MGGPVRYNDGPLIPDYTTLAGTSATAVLPSNGNRILNELQISNGTGSAVTCVVDVYNTGTSTSLYELEPGKVVTTTGKLDHDGILLEDGIVIRVAGAADVQVFVTYYKGADDRPHGLSASAATNR